MVHNLIFELFMGSSCVHKHILFVLAEAVIQLSASRAAMKMIWLGCHHHMIIILKSRSAY